jgi:hypothetical protein
MYGAASNPEKFAMPTETTPSKKLSQNRDNNGSQKSKNLKTDANSSFWDESDDGMSNFSDFDERKTISRAPLRRLSRNAPSIGSLGDTYIGSSPTF